MAVFLFAFFKGYHIPKKKFQIYPVERVTALDISYDEGIATVISKTRGKFKVRMRKKDYLTIKNNLDKPFLYSYVPYLAISLFRIEDDDVFMGEDSWVLYYK